MGKKNILGICNLLLSFLFLYFFIFSGIYTVPQLSWSSLTHAYAPGLILLIAWAINGILAYRNLIKKDFKHFKIQIILTLVTIGWFLLLFLGFFIVSRILFPLITLILVVIIFLAIYKDSKKIAFLLSFTTILAAGITILSNFEEDYCWSKGDQADAAGQKWIIATEKDADALKEFDIKKGDKIGAGFRAHMLCHQTFQFTEALNERYLFRK